MHLLHFLLEFSIELRRINFAIFVEINFLEVLAVFLTELIFGQDAILVLVLHHADADRVGDERVAVLVVESQSAGVECVDPPATIWAAHIRCWIGARSGASLGVASRAAR